MRPPGAYTDEMGDLDHLTELVHDVRAAYVVPPDEETESRHLAAMAEAVRAHTDLDLSNQTRPRRRPRTRAIKEALIMRTRTAALATKLASLTLVAAFATGGLAVAGVISLPNPLPDQASDRAKDVHDAIDGSNPAEERCAFGLAVAEAASDGNGDRPSSSDACEQENSSSQEAKSEAERGKSGEEHGKSDAARENGDVETQQNGAHPVEGAGREFGDSVSDDATTGVPRDGGGRGFGESVSGGAKELVPRPTPPNGAETGETQSQEGQANGETRAQGGPETGQTIAGEHKPER